MKSLYLLLVIVIFSISLFGQHNLKLDLINNNYILGDTLVITLDNIDGNIQWQESLDLSIWNDILGQIDDSLIYIVDTSKYLRASVVYGNCNPYFSDTLQIIASDTLVLGSPCPGTPIIYDYDGNSYNTVLIGTQCWMAENIKTTHYANGTTIPHVTNDSIWITLEDNSTDKAYCYYGNSTNNLTTYGALYTWAAAMNGETSSNTNPSGVQGVCPTGWHLPSNPEWTQLTDYLGGYYVAGGKLKESGILHWNYPNTEATNISGFTGLPSGVRHNYNGQFQGMGKYAFWWSTTESNIIYAWFRVLYHQNGFVEGNVMTKSKGFAVRCIKDTAVQAYYPVVITDTISNITMTTASCTGEVTDNGSATIIERGFCWNHSGNPTLLDSTCINGTVTGSFTSNITNLISYTTYYIKAYATNSVGTSYGNEISFTTLDTLTYCPSTVSDYDGNTYNTVLLGTQCWMAENINTTHYANGISIPNVTVDTAWAALGNNNIDDAFCYYDNYSYNGSIYGSLYTWAAAMGDNGVSSNTVPSGIQGVCPLGWHLPSDNEWKQLEMHLGMSQNLADTDGCRGTNEGSKLAGNSSLWNNGNLENDSLFDSSGFNGLPGGIRQYYDGDCWQIESNSYWWTTTETYSGMSAHRRAIAYFNTCIQRLPERKSNGFSIRCLKD